MARFVIVPDESIVSIAARSSVGPINWQATGATGVIEVEVHDGVIDPAVPPHAELELDVENLSSGNALYDAELLRRINARRHPTTTVELSQVSPIGDDRFQLQGQVTFHGVTSAVSGAVQVAFADDGTMLVTGEQVMDIRDFDIPSPSILMLKIFPDVRVHLDLRAVREA